MAIDPVTVGLLGVFVLGSAPTLVGGYVRRDYHAGVDCMRQERWQAASEHFLRFLDRVQKYPSLKTASYFSFVAYDVEAMAYCHLGVCALAQEDERAARRYLERAVKVDPGLPTAHYNLGLVLLRQKDRLGTARCFHQARATGLLPADFDASLARIARGQAPERATSRIAELYAQHGLMEDAARCFGHAASHSEQGALEGWVESMLRLGRWSEVGEEVEHLLQELSQQPWTHTLAAFTKAASGDFNAALMHQDHALALAPGHAEAHSYKAELLWAAGRWDEAESALEPALRIDPHHAASHALLAQLRVREKAWEAALSHAETALAADPTRAHALEARAFALHGLNRDSEARTAFHSFLNVVKLLAPMESNLEFRQSLAARMAADLETA